MTLEGNLAVRTAQYRETLRLTRSYHSRDRHMASRRDHIPHNAGVAGSSPAPATLYIIDRSTSLIGHDLGFKRYEDASLSYVGINKHEGDRVGLFDTVLNSED